MSSIPNACSNIKATGNYRLVADMEYRIEAFRVHRQGRDTCGIHDKGGRQDHTP